MLRRSIPLFAMAAWLAFVGVAMWQHARVSTQPPIYDAATYFIKAHNFWTSLSEGKVVNPLNLEPDFRPPGTIAMSYPLGFSTDYRGFYFRSIFLPVVLVALAVLVAGYRRELDSARQWTLVALAAFLTSIPAFYYFELAPEFAAPSHWGIVDNFLGGVAALAVAAVIRSIWRDSTAWLVAAALFASFCLMIKPSGALVMALVGLVWLAVALLRLLAARHDPVEKRMALAATVKGMLAFGIPYLAVLAASFSSHYFSRGNLAFGSGAIALKRIEEPVTWDAVQGMLHLSLGYPLLAWVALTGVLLARAWPRVVAEPILLPRNTTAALLFAAAVAFAFGLWFWIYGSGGIYQVRYCVPFVLMAGVLAVPAIVRAAPVMRHAEALLFFGLMVATAANIDLLLVQAKPPIAWQHATGVNMSSGQRDPLVAQASQLVDAVKREGRDATVYSMSMDATDAVFQSVIGYARIQAPTMPLISVLIPGDLIRPTAYRVGEMVAADYWLFRPVRDDRLAQEIVGTPSIDTLDQEQLLFQAWAMQLAPADGVEVVSDTPGARLLRVTDAGRLEAALDRLIAAHRWREVFVAANPPNQLSETTLAEALAVYPPLVENVRFGDRIEMRALSATLTGEDTTFRLWWQPLPAMTEHDWVFFIHVVDDAGKMLTGYYMPLNLSVIRPGETRIRFDSATFKIERGDPSQRLAVGFIRPNQTPLLADKGPRDWGGMRLIVMMP